MGNYTNIHTNKDYVNIKEHKHFRLSKFISSTKYENLIGLFTHGKMDSLTLLEHFHIDKNDMRDAHEFVIDIGSMSNMTFMESLEDYDLYEWIDDDPFSTLILQSK